MLGFENTERLIYFINSQKSFKFNYILRILYVTVSLVYLCLYENGIRSNISQILVNRENNVKCVCYFSEKSNYKHTLNRRKVTTS